MPITGKHFGLMLCEAFGLSPKGVTRIELVADINKPASVTISRYLEEDGIVGQ